MVSLYSMLWCWIIPKQSVEEDFPSVIWKIGFRKCHSCSSLCRLLGLVPGILHIWNSVLGEGGLWLDSRKSKRKTDNIWASHFNSGLDKEEVVCSQPSGLTNSEHLETVVNSTYPGPHPRPNSEIMGVGLCNPVLTSFPGASWSTKSLRTVCHHRHSLYNQNNKEAERDCCRV